MTVKELMIECVQLVRAGDGDMEVLCSDDEEWNGFHEIGYGLTKTDVIIAECKEQAGFEPDDIEPHKVIIG